MVYLFKQQDTWLKGKPGFISFRVIYPTQGQIALHVTATYRKVIKLFLVLNDKWKTLKFSNWIRYARIFVLFVLEQSELLEYENKSWKSMPLMEKKRKGYFQRTSIFPHLIPIWCWTKHTIGHLVLKKCCVLVHIYQLLYVQLKNGEGEKERTEKLYCSQDVVEPHRSFLTENVFLVWRNRILELSSRFPFE